MRNLKTILKSLSLGLAVGVAACEESPPPPRPVPVTVSENVPQTPPPALAPTAQELPPPPVPTSDVVQHQHVEVVDVSTLSTGEVIQRARLALKDHDIDEALRLGHVAVVREPDRSAAWNVLGRAQLQRGARKAAIESLKKAVSLNPSSSWAGNNLGLALIYDGQYEAAVAALEAATQQPTVEPYMWNNLGMAYEHLDRLDEARSAYGKAVAMASSSATRNLARLEGVKSIRLARADHGASGVGDTVDTDETKPESDTHAVATDTPSVGTDTPKVDTDTPSVVGSDGGK